MAVAGGFLYDKLEIPNAISTKTFSYQLQNQSIKIKNLLLYKNHLTLPLLQKTANPIKPHFSANF